MRETTPPRAPEDVLMNTLGDERWKPIALLVDSDSESRREVEELLKEQGCERYCFAEAPAALRFVPMLSGGRVPDLVLCGGSNAGAQEFRRQLQAIPGLETVPFYSYHDRFSRRPELLRERIAAYVSTVYQRRRLTHATRELKRSTERVRAHSMPPRKWSGGPGR